jgi:hypothetical protein
MELWTSCEQLSINCIRSLSLFGSGHVRAGTVDGAGWIERPETSCIRTVAGQTVMLIFKSGCVATFEVTGW